MFRRLLFAFIVSIPLPAAAANCVVTSGANSGAGTLRDCLGSVGNGDTITFSVATVTLTAGLPLIPAGVTVDGGGTVTLDGTAAPAANGLRPTDDCTVQGMRIVGFPGAVGILANGDDITIEDNVIVGPNGGGILADTGSGYLITGNTVGEVGQSAVEEFGIGLFQVDGATVTDNVVVGVALTGVGNGNGIELNQPINVEVRGNHVGVLADGATAFGNENIGIVVEFLSGTGNVVADNVVSANDGDGILVADGSDGVQLLDNRVGTDSSGMTAIGNGGDGIRISASDDAVIDRNVIADNSGSGIKLVNAIAGDYQSGQQIRGNRIGVATDGWTPMGNGEHGVVSFGQGGGHVVERNVIGSNGKHGIWIDDVGGDPIVVRRNSVGTDVSRSQLLGNGGGSGAWHGIFVTATGDVTIGERNGGNYVANSVTGHGIFLSLAQGVEVLGNTVASNFGDGIRSRGGSLIGIGSEDAGNVVWSNGFSGIAVLATSASGPSDIQVLGNQVGDPSRGNADDGIRVEWATGDAAFSDILIQSNSVGSNGGVGIRLEGSGLDDVEMHRNTLTDNGLCPVLLQNGANSAGGMATAPSGIVVAANEEGATGTWAGTGNLVSVEVYSDAGDELAHFHGEGSAGVTAGTWTFALGFGPGQDPIEELSQGRVSVMITVDDGGIQRTSAVTNLGGDGCSGTSCNDFNPRTTDTFGGGSCSHANVANGTACQSGDPWTTDTCQTGVCTQGAPGVVGIRCDGEMGGLRGALIFHRQRRRYDPSRGRRCDPAAGCRQRASRSAGSAALYKGSWHWATWVRTWWRS